MAISMITIIPTPEGFTVHYGDVSKDFSTKGGVLTELAKLFAYEEFLEVKEEVGGFFSAMFDSAKAEAEEVITNIEKVE